MPRLELSDAILRQKASRTTVHMPLGIDEKADAEDSESDEEDLIGGCQVLYVDEGERACIVCDADEVRLGPEEAALIPDSSSSFQC